MLGHALCHALSFHSKTITHSITNNLPQSKQLLRSLNNGCKLLPTSFYLLSSGKIYTPNATYVKDYVAFSLAVKVKLLFTLQK